jgi:hypothetical protein
MTQTEWVLNNLLAGKGVTPIDALNGCGCFRLAAVVFNLREAGWDIENVPETNLLTNKRYARYFMRTPHKL